MDNEEMALADFEAAFSEEDGYQTEPTEETTDDEPSEGEESAETGEEEGSDAGDENAGEEGEEEGKEEPGQDDGGGKAAAEDSFTIKVNKEERTVTREEVISLAQKGADYDRVKEQLTQTRQQNQTLLEQAEKNKDVLGVLQMLADGVNMPLDQFVDQLHVNFLVKGGKTEGEAREKIRADRAEKQLSEKTYRFTVLAAEYVCDVMRFIRMADSIVITDKYGRTYNCDTFLMTPKWETQGNLASVEVEFQTNTVAKRIGRAYTSNN